ncbi:MAG: MotA/TolQ/ExbB proton channel family protein [Planctomycetota bacterium]|jgi:biopolymer transport protein ExbB|nr:MotA/TolQ/ExbB proton channel family protein [Planctomycetota bacterium]MDA1200807.1 MotA/TolQ/ExbB proton channel family protein [Planctomycetota bacterium]
MTALDRVSTLWQLFLAGGLLMWPIVAMSLVVVTFGIERLVALRRRRFVPPELARELAELEAGRFDPRLAYRLCSDHPSVAGRVVQATLEKIGRPLPEIERAVEVEKEREASQLYANIRPLSLAVSVTPLLGLLGTVQGMIIAFYTTANLEAGANRAAELAQGIYVALITTFAGLCVAIPAAMIAHYLEGRILKGFREVDDVVDGVLPHLERFEGKGRVTPAQLAATPPPPAARPAVRHPAEARP